MTLDHAVYVGGMRTMNKTTWKHIDIGSLCVHCGKDTAFGHSDMLFVDRISADTDLLDSDGKPIGVKEGYMCRECQFVDDDDFFHINNLID